MIDAADAKLIEELIQKWRKEADLIKRQLSMPWSESWQIKDVERIYCLERFANELEVIL